MTIARARTRAESNIVQRRRLAILVELSIALECCDLCLSRIAILQERKLRQDTAQALIDRLTIPHAVARCLKHSDAGMSPSRAGRWRQERSRSPRRRATTTRPAAPSCRALVVFLHAPRRAELARSAHPRERAPAGSPPTPFLAAFRAGSKPSPYHHALAAQSCR
jgi:hypothetical protein